MKDLVAVYAVSNHPSNGFKPSVKLHFIGGIVAFSDRWISYFYFSSCSPHGGFVLSQTVFCSLIDSG